MEHIDDINVDYIMQNQPIVNIGMLGHVQNGKSTIVKNLTMKHTQQHSDEKSRNITIKLGYANAKLYKCDHCEPPQCYSSTSSDVYKLSCKYCSNEMKLVNHVSFVDCFGTDTQIMLHDGSTKYIDKLEIGNMVIGIDGVPVKIMNIQTGEKKMYNVMYGNKSFDNCVVKNFTCTGGHLLVLYMVDNVTDIYYENDMYIYDVYNFENNILSSKRIICPSYSVAYNSRKKESGNIYKFNMTIETYLNMPQLFKKIVCMGYCGEINFDAKLTKYEFMLPHLKQSEIGWLFGIWLTSIDMCTSILNNIIVSNKIRHINGRINGGVIQQFHEMIENSGILNTDNMVQYLLFQTAEFRQAIVDGMRDATKMDDNNMYTIMKPDNYHNIINIIELILRSLSYNVLVRKYKSKKRNTYYTVSFNNEKTQLQQFDVKPLGVQKYIGFEIEGSSGIFLTPDLLCVHNCPGHHGLMATMLNGTCIMDYSIIVESLNNSMIPSPQTIEHINATAITGVPNKLVCVNKLDLVTRDDAENKIKSIKKKLSKTIAHGSPIIPVVASKNLNMDILSEYLANIPIPLRSYNDSDLKMYIVRSFNVNKPGTQIIELSGGVIGGSMLSGIIRKGMCVILKPGFILKNDDGEWMYRSLKAKILSIHSEKNSLEYAVPGGLIGVQLDIDPGLCANDKLSGNIMIAEQNEDEYNVYDEFIIKYVPLHENDYVTKGMKIILNVNADNKGAEITDVNNNLLNIKTYDPTCLKLGDNITISCQKNRDNEGIKVVGRGEFIEGIHKLTSFEEFGNIQK